MKGTQHFSNQRFGLFCSDITKPLAADASLTGSSKALQLFVKHSVTNKTHVVCVPAGNLSYEKILKAFYKASGASTRLTAFATLSLNGKEIGPTNWQDVRAHDTLALKECSLLGGSLFSQLENGQVPLLDERSTNQVGDCSTNLKDSELCRMLKLDPMAKNEKILTLQNLHDLDEEQSVDIKGINHDEFFWLYRPGTEGEQILVIDQYKGSVPCHTLQQQDISWSEPIDRTHQLKIYNMSEDRKKWDMESTTNLNLTGKVIHGLREIRPSYKDIAFMSANFEKQELSVNIISEGQTQITSTKIQPSTDLHKYMMKYQHINHHQFFRDSDKNDMVVYTTWHEDEILTIHFYDITLEKTIVRVEGVAYIYHMSHPTDYFSESAEHQCIFEKYGCNIDFVAARHRTEAVEINLEKDIDQKVTKNKTFKHKFCDEQWEMRDWSKQGKQGFAAWHGPTSKMIMVEVESPTELKLIETKEEVTGEHWFWQADLIKWTFEDKTFDTQPRYQDGPCERLEDVHNFLIMNRIGQQTIFVFQPSTKRLVGFTFQGQILTFAAPQILQYSGDNPRANEREPHFTVVTENRKIQECHIVKIEFEKNGKNINESFKVTEKAVSEKWRQELIKIENQKHICTYEDWGQDTCLWLQTKKKLVMLYYNNETKVWHEDSDEWSLVSINMLHLLRLVYVAYNNHSGKTFFVYITGQHNVFYEMDQTQVLQVNVINDIIHILDSDFNLRRLGLTKGEDHSPKVTWSDIRSLKHIKELTMASKLESQQIGLTDTTLALNDKVILLETGKTLFHERDTKIKLLQNALIIQKDNQLKFKSNPGSRRLSSISTPMLKFMQKLYQVSPDLLLLQRSDAEWTEWLMIGINGTFVDMPSDLNQALQSSADSQSFYTESGRCQLLLTQRTAEKNLKSAKVIELTEAGQIASQTDLKLSIATIGECFAQDQILRNFNGDLLQVRVAKITKDEVSEPQLLINGKLGLIVFESATEKMQMVFAGKFFCWATENQVLALNLETSAIKKIQLKEKQSEFVQINACEPRCLVEAGLLSKIDRKGVLRLADHLQITVGEKAQIFNLQPEKPTVVDEIDMNGLFNAEKFIETGFMLTNGKRTLQASPLNNLVIETQGDRDIYVYRKFTSNDIAAAQSMMQKQHNIQTDVLWATFEDQTLLSLIKGDATCLNAVYDHLASQDFSDSSEQMRRIKFLLQKRTLKMTDDGELIAESPLSEVLLNSTFRDPLLKIGNLSPDFSLLSMFDDQMSLIAIAEHATPALTDSLANSLWQTSSMKSIRVVAWPADLKQFVYKTKTLEISQEQLEGQIKTEVGSDRICVDKPVRVDVINSRQLLKVHTMLMAKMPLRFFKSRFMDVTFNQLWNQTRLDIFWTQFLPFMACIILIVLQFDYVLSQQETDGQYKDSWITCIKVYRVLGAITLALLAQFLCIEVKQAMRMKLCYFKDCFNLLDLAGLLLSSTIIVLALFSVEWLSFDQLRLMMCLASFSLMIKFFGWLRVFDSTSFYISLIECTVSDIKAFLLLSLIAMLTFALPLSMLEVGQDWAVREPFGIWLVDNLFSMYLLSLGEFQLLEAGYNEKSIIAFFALASFFTIVIMLNMMIPIMGDSFARVAENKEKFAAIARLRILGGYLPLNDDHVEWNNYMVVVKPMDDQSDDSESETLQMKIEKVSSMTKKSILNLQQEVKTSLLEHQSTILMAVKAENKASQAKMSKVEAKIVEKSAKVEADVAVVKDLLEKLVEAQNSKEKKEQEEPFYF